VKSVHAASIPDELEACYVQSAAASDIELCAGVWQMTMQAAYHALCLHACVLGE